MKLDRIDRAILRALQNNARLTNKELSARVGLAPSSCLERVRKLEENKVILGYQTLVDPDFLGVKIQAVVSVRLNQHAREMIEKFEEHILSLDETIAFYHVSGADDYLVHVGVRDPNHLREFALEALNSRPDVAHVQTALVFRCRQTAALPDFLDHAI